MGIVPLSQIVLAESNSANISTPAHRAYNCAATKKRPNQSLCLRGQCSAVAPSGQVPSRPLD